MRYMQCNLMTDLVNINPSKSAKIEPKIQYASRIFIFPLSYSVSVSDNGVSICGGFQHRNEISHPEVMPLK